MTNSERKVTIPWEGLAETLRRSGKMFFEEEIREITLVKPKQILLRLQKLHSQKGESDVPK